MNRRIAYKIVNRIVTRGHRYTAEQRLRAYTIFIRDMRKGPDAHLADELQASVQSLFRLTKELQFFPGQWDYQDAPDAVSPRCAMLDLAPVPDIRTIANMFRVPREIIEAGNVAVDQRDCDEYAAKYIRAKWYGAKDNGR